jgi:hypothetical protein
LGFNSWQGQSFSLLQSIQTCSGAHQASYPMGIRAISAGVKQPGREADHSPPSSSKVKMVELNLHSAIHLHGIVLNELSAGTTLPHYTRSMKLL